MKLVPGPLTLKLARLLAEEASKREKERKRESTNKKPTPKII